MESNIPTVICSIIIILLVIIILCYRKKIYERFHDKQINVDKNKKHLMHFYI